MFSTVSSYLHKVVIRPWLVFFAYIINLTLAVNHWLKKMCYVRVKSLHIFVFQTCSTGILANHGRQMNSLKTKLVVADKSSILI